MSSAARVRVTSRPVISTATAFPLWKRSVPWPSTQRQPPSRVRRRSSISEVRGSSGPAAAIAARSFGTSSKWVMARHSRPISSSWRSPSASVTDGLAYSISPLPSNIHTRSGESSTIVVTRAAARALASAAEIGVKTAAIMPSLVGAERTENQWTPPSSAGMPYSWSMRPPVRSTRATGYCSGGSDPPPGASRTDGSDGWPISSSRVRPTMLANASLTSTITLDGSKTIMPSSSERGSGMWVWITDPGPSGNRRHGLCTRSPESGGHRRACGADWRRGRRRGDRRRTSWGPTRARVAARG